MRGTLHSVESDLSVYTSRVAEWLVHKGTLHKNLIILTNIVNVHSFSHV